MKTQVLKASFGALLLLTLFVLPACRKDDDDDAMEPQDPSLKSELVGEWNITSFKLDTFEYMQVIVERSVIRFDAYTGAKGNYRHTIEYADGELEVLTGEYRVDEAARELHMALFHDNRTVFLEISTDGKRMYWSGEQDGNPLTVRAERIK